MGRNFRAVVTLGCSDHHSHKVCMYSTDDCMALLMAAAQVHDYRKAGYRVSLATQYLADDGSWRGISIEDAIADDQRNGVTCEQ